MKDMQWLKETVFCHRGLHNNRDVPENSRAAFLRAAEAGLATTQGKSRSISEGTRSNSRFKEAAPSSSERRSMPSSE